MRFLVFQGWGGTPNLLEVAVVALLLASGCAGVEAYSHGTGAFNPGAGSFNHGTGVLALDWGKCDQSDSTVTCCLKNHPGQYERCGATPPKQPQPINRPPPLLRPPGEEENRYDEHENICLPRYVRCVDEIGLKPGSRAGTSQCQDCFEYCMKHGFWPARMNKQRCPGIEP
jgi:hypothetical protein